MGETPNSATVWELTRRRRRTTHAVKAATSGQYAVRALPGAPPVPCARGAEPVAVTPQPSSVRGSIGFSQRPSAVHE